MINLWRWIPHDHGENALFAGGLIAGADHCKRCGRFHIWMTERLRDDLIVIMHFYGYGKALKSRYDADNPRDQVRGWEQGLEVHDRE